MEPHYCAHPLIPGYGPPDTLGELVPPRPVGTLGSLRAQTLTGLENHDDWLYSWRRIKHDFLHHFHMPRCDLLVWILVTKLAPTYYRKLDQLLTETARYRELSSWRKGFNKNVAKTAHPSSSAASFSANTSFSLCTVSPQSSSWRQSDIENHLSGGTKA